MGQGSDVAEVLKVRYGEFMSKVISINSRGTLTLPSEMRRRFGLNNAGPVVAEETMEGILLRPGFTLPIEIYSGKRVAEFEESDADLEPFVDRLNDRSLDRKQA